MEDNITDNIILLKNCMKVATFNSSMDELEDTSILIKEHRIEKIGKNLENSIDENEINEVIDCSNHLIIPGMINTHHHLFQNLTRNLPETQNLELFDWLNKLYPIWENLDDESIYYSTLLGFSELLKTGATTTTDHHYLYPGGIKKSILGIQFQAASEIGIRFSPSRGSMTMSREEGGLPPKSVTQNTDDVIKDSMELIEKYHDDSPLSMRRIILAPCSPFSVEKRLMIETAKLARNHCLILHTHIGETQNEQKYCLNKYGMRPLALMVELGWIGEDVYFAHGIHFNDSELETIRESNTKISHCPTSNMRLGSGIARVREMLDMDITVGLGVDGSSSNDSSDMLGEVRNALMLQRVRYGADGLSAREALKMAIRGGSDILNYHHLGSIEEGKGADLVVFDMNKIQYAGGLSDPLASIVFAGFNHETSYTIVNGRIVVRNGKIPAIDEKTIIDNVNRIAGNLLDV